MEYLVTWSIELDAKSFEEAARLAREIQLDPNSLAIHFVVKDQKGVEKEVWLD